MYELTISLKYGDLLRLDSKYRYDFVGINYEHDFNFESIFVFRTIKEGKGTGNVLIDAIHHSNISAISTTLHGDCHFHIFNSEDVTETKIIEITENILLEKIENKSNHEYYVTLKEQKYKLINGIPCKDSDCKRFSIVKYLLFTQYHEQIANMSFIELSPIFKLQMEHIWHNNRYGNFNNIHRLDVDKIVGRELDPSTPWAEVKNIIKKEREGWGEKEREKYKQLLNLKSSQSYLPIE